MNENKLKKLLKKNNYTIYTLSKLTDLNDKGLGMIVNGNTKNPRIDTIVKIAKALDLNNDEFAELCGYTKEDH